MYPSGGGVSFLGFKMGLKSAFRHWLESNYQSGLFSINLTWSEQVLIAQLGRESLGATAFDNHHGLALESDDPLKFF